jgi:hypothetical protein
MPLELGDTLLAGSSGLAIIRKSFRVALHEEAALTYLSDLMCRKQSGISRFYRLTDGPAPIMQTSHVRALKCISVIDTQTLKLCLAIIRKYSALSSTKK